MILLQLEVPLETVYAAIRFGKKHGVRTVLNPAPAVKTLDLSVVRQANFVAPNETELAILTGMPVESEDEIVAAAKSLIERRDRDGDRNARRARFAARSGADLKAHRPAQGRRGGFHRRRGRLHRQLRTLRGGRFKTSTTPSKKQRPMPRIRSRSVAHRSRSRRRRSSSRFARPARPVDELKPQSHLIHRRCRAAQLLRLLRWDSRKTDRRDGRLLQW